MRRCYCGGQCRQLVGCGPLHELGVATALAATAAQTGGYTPAAVPAAPSKLSSSNSILLHIAFGATEAAVHLWDWQHVLLPLLLLLPASNRAAFGRARRWAGVGPCAERLQQQQCTQGGGCDQAIHHEACADGLWPE